MAHGLDIRVASMDRLCEAVHCARREAGCEGWRMERAAYTHATSLEEDYIETVNRLLAAAALRLEVNPDAFENPDFTTALVATLFQSDIALVAGTPVAAERELKKTRIVEAHRRLKELERFDDADDDDSAMVRCRKCKSRDIGTVSQQKASADEPATITCSCGQCGYRWKLAR